MSRYLTPDVPTPELYTPAEEARIAAEEFAAYEGRALAQSLLARNGGNRLQALAWLEYRWSDTSITTEAELMVRAEATAALLCDANPIERDAYEATQAHGVTSYEAALAAIAVALTQTATAQQVAA